jgi:hypothetical protein
MDIQCESRTPSGDPMSGSALGITLGRATLIIAPLYLWTEERKL